MVRKNTGEALSREAAIMRSLAKDIGGLQDLGLLDLRQRYREVYGEEPRSKNLPYLRKKIAFRVQERMEGGLSVAAEARIQELVAVELPFEASQTARRPALKAASGQPVASEPRDPRLPQAGTLVIREFKGSRTRCRCSNRPSSTGGGRIGASRPSPRRSPARPGMASCSSA